MTGPIERSGITAFLSRHGRALALVLFFAAYYVRFIKKPDGMTLYPLAATALLESRSLESVAPGFTYPPVFAFLMIPFAPMPMWLRNLVWYAVLISATILSWRICESLVTTMVQDLWKNGTRNWLRFVTMILSLKVTLAVFENQAYDVVVFLCILLGLNGLINRKEAVGAFGFAAAAALKATPLLLFPYLLLRRRWKLFLFSVVFYLGFSLLPDLFFTPKETSSGYFATWLREIALGMSPTKDNEGAPRQWEEPNPLNQSLRGLLFRMSDKAGNGEGKNYRAGIVYGIYGLLVLWFLLRSSYMENPFVLDVAVLLISMLLLSPMSSKSHFVVLILPYMLATAMVIKEQRFRWMGGTLLGLSFALITLTSRDIIGSRLSNVCLSAGCVTYGTLILLFSLGYMMWSVTNKPMEEPSS